MATIGADGVTNKPDGIEFGSSSQARDDRIGFIIKQLQEQENVEQDRLSIKDYSWFKNTFIITEMPDSPLKEWVDKRRFSCLADQMFSSTAVGLNLAVNPKPQFTRTADIRRPGRVKNRDTNELMRKYKVPHYDISTSTTPYGLGMGRVYAQAFDANEQRLYLQFGDPQFASMLFWIGKSFDVHKAILHKRGFISATLLQAVNLFTKFWAITSMPWLYMGKVLLEGIVMPSQFVTLKNNMYSYWSIVDTLVNKMFVRRTRVPFLQTVDPTTDQSLEIGTNANTAKNFAVFTKSLNDLIPDIIDPGGRINVFAAVLKGPAVLNKSMVDSLEVTYRSPTSSQNLDTYNTGNNDMSDYFNGGEQYKENFVGALFGLADRTVNKTFPSNGNAPNLIDAVLNEIKGLAGGEGMQPTEYGEVHEEADLPSMVALQQETVDASGNELNVKTATQDADETADGLRQANLQSSAKKEQLRLMGEYMLESLTGGFAFAVFNVEHTGSVGESFSNSSETNPIETVFNSVSSKIRSAFNVGSSMMEIPVIGDVAKFAASAAAITVSNLSFGLANPLLALLYGTTVNLPKHWASAAASLPRANYRIRLGTPYGNMYSQLFHIYLPLSMLLPGVLSRGVGLHTHISPFMCRSMDPGRVNIMYGMIDSLSITRGVSSLSFNESGHANAIDVEFSIVDLNEMITLELGNNGVLTKTIKALIPDFTETALDTYINTVVGMDVYSMYYRAPKIRLQLIEKGMALRTLADPAARAAATANIINSLTPDFLEGMVQEVRGWTTTTIRSMYNL